MKSNIELFTCQLSKCEYEILIITNLKSATPYEFINASEQFYKKAIKTLEFTASSIIKDILNEFNITYIENNDTSYESALNSLKSMHKRLLITNTMSCVEKDTGIVHKVVKDYGNVRFLLDDDSNLYMRQNIKVVDYV